MWNRAVEINIVKNKFLTIMESDSEFVNIFNLVMKSIFALTYHDLKTL